LFRIIYNIHPCPLYAILRANALRRLARSISAGVSDATSAAFTTSDISGPRQERVGTFVVLQDAVLLQEANRVGQPLGELEELVTEEVSLGEPNVVDDGLDASLSGLSELNLDGSIASDGVDGKAVSFEEDGDVVRTSRGNAEAVDISQSSSEAVVTNEEVREEHILVKDLNHFVSVASSVGLGKSKHGALNATTIADEDITVVDDAFRQLVAPSEGFGVGSDECESASENDKEKSLVHGLLLCVFLIEIKTSELIRYLYFRFPLHKIYSRAKTGDDDKLYQICLFWTNVLKNRINIGTFHAFD
jgi:hypothetical protein